MTTHDSTSDFLAKWLMAGPTRNEFRNNIKESLEAANEMNRHSPLNKEKKIRPKTPLHLVEPQGDFDPDVMDLFDLMEVENEAMNSLGGGFDEFPDEGFGPQLLESQAKENNTESRLQDPAQHDDFIKPTNFNAEVQIFRRSLETSYEFAADKSNFQLKQIKVKL